MHHHKDTFLKLEQLGGWPPPDYRPTHNFQGQFIDDAHRYYAECPDKRGLIQVPCNGRYITGWQLRQDALKLYELAYFCQGDILELGMLNGLSTSILSQANHNSPHAKTIYSVDIFQGNVDNTNETIRAMGLDKNVITLCDDATSAVKKFVTAGRCFALVFVDHDHAYQPTFEICLELKNLVMAGGFCLFHDFNHSGNADMNNTDYDVYRAINDSLLAEDFEFYGIFGASALYRSLYSGLPSGCTHE